MERSAKRISPSIRFIDQFLAKRSPGSLTGLLLGQLDAFNRITTTFGHDQSNDFCTQYSEELRETFPPGTPVIRLSGRRFAVVFSPDSMAGIIDVTVNGAPREIAAETSAEDLVAMGRTPYLSPFAGSR